MSCPQVGVVRTVNREHRWFERRHLVLDTTIENLLVALRDGSEDGLVARELVKRQLIEDASPVAVGEVVDHIRCTNRAVVVGSRCSKLRFELCQLRAL